MIFRGEGNVPMSISMVIVAVLAVGGLVFVSVFATEHIFAPLRHGKRVLKRELRGADDPLHAPLKQAGLVQ